MAATWDHPVLARFEYRDGWASELHFPVFDAFSYDTGYGNARRSTGRHGLLFWARNERDVPSPATAALAARVVANQAELVVTIAGALWDDFNGRGPDYGNWWHGRLAEVAQVVGPERALRGPEDVPRLLRLDAVFVRRAEPGMPGYDKPAAEVAFHAAFEEEHGIGVLTDGDAVLGIGHILDVVLFEAAKQTPRPGE